MLGWKKKKHRTQEINKRIVTVSKVYLVVARILRPKIFPQKQALYHKNGYAAYSKVRMRNMDLDIKIRCLGIFCKENIARVTVQ